MILEQYRWFQAQGWTSARIIRLVNTEQSRHGHTPVEYDVTGDGAFQAMHDLYDILEERDDTR